MTNLDNGAMPDYARREYKSNNNEGTDSKKQGGSPASQGRSNQELASELGLTRQFGVVRCMGRIEFTIAHRLVFETDNAWEAMQHLEACLEELGEEENCFLLLNENTSPPQV
jgi:hypothetical protein